MRVHRVGAALAFTAAFLLVAPVAHAGPIRMVKGVVQGVTNEVKGALQPLRDLTRRTKRTASTEKKRAEKEARQALLKGKSDFARKASWDKKGAEEAGKRTKARLKPTRKRLKEKSRVVKGDYQTELSKLHKSSDSTKRHRKSPRKSKIRKRFVSPDYSK